MSTNLNDEEEIRPRNRQTAISIVQQVQFSLEGDDTNSTTGQSSQLRKTSINLMCRGSGEINSMPQVGVPGAVAAEDSNNNSQVLEARRSRNKSFCKAKVINKRNQIREKFKNDFFSGMKGALLSSGKKPVAAEEGEESNGQVNPEVSAFESMTVTTTSTTETSVVVQSSEDNKEEGEGNQFNVSAFTEEHIVEPVFLRVASTENTNSDHIQEDRECNIFHIVRGGGAARSQEQNGQCQSFEEVYTLSDVLGEGCVGLVKKAIKIADGCEYAVKIVRTRDEETIQNIRNEFLHLRKLSHKNIVKVYEIYIDKAKGKIYSVMELINGREMFEVINQLGSYCEDKARKIFKQIIEAIQYMHSHYVCHRDLKPNNILCDESGDHVKITDFNVSKFSDSYKDYSNAASSSSIKMWTYTGTIAFSAPEIFNENCYDENIDVWSAGVILYTMLCGKEPFQAEFVQDLIQKIVKGEYSFPADPWDRISENAKDLIRQCLTINPEERIKPEAMAVHPWLEESNCESKSQELDRNKLFANLDRLVKGRTNSFEKNDVRRLRSQTLSYPANYFKTSDFMFSNKCFGNPQHSDEDEDENGREHEDCYSMLSGESSPKKNSAKKGNIRAARMTVAERPCENRPRSGVLQLQPFELQQVHQKAKVVNFADNVVGQKHQENQDFLKQSELTVFAKRSYSQSIDPDAV